MNEDLLVELKGLPDENPQAAHDRWQVEGDRTVLFLLQEGSRESPLCSITTAQSGEILTRQAAYANQFFVIVEGGATVWRNGIKNDVKGDFFGEMALLEGNKRSATVVAETDLRLLVLSRRDFRSLTLVAPAAIQRIMVGLSARLRHGTD